MRSDKPRGEIMLEKKQDVILFINTPSHLIKESLHLSHRLVQLFLCMFGSFQSVVSCWYGAVTVQASTVTIPLVVTATCSSTWALPAGSITRGAADLLAHSNEFSGIMWVEFMLSWCARSGKEKQSNTDCDLWNYLSVKWILPCELFEMSQKSRKLKANEKVQEVSVRLATDVQCFYSTVIFLQINEI